MVLIAFANAAVRELLLAKHYNEFRAHQLSTITLIILCAIYVWFIIPLLHVQNAKQALLIGFIWMVLTVLFEFTLGRLTNKSWDYLLQDYNVLAGRLWLLFLLSLLLLPYLFYALKNK